MKRVVTVELDGSIFDLHEDAYNELRRYLRRAEARAAAHPERKAVMADLERSIAQRLQPRHVSPKSVISFEAMRNVLVQVDADCAWTGEASRGGATDDRMLVQVREGAMVSGVCKGLAVRFGIDVTIVRVIFIVLAVVTSGGFVLAYVAMMLLIPYDSDVERIDDQSLPGFMFKLVTRTKRKLAAMC